MIPQYCSKYGKIPLTLTHGVQQFIVAMVGHERKTYPGADPLVKVATTWEGYLLTKM